jgi:antitoxin MazE
MVVSRIHFRALDGFGDFCRQILHSVYTTFECPQSMRLFARCHARKSTLMSASDDRARAHSGASPLPLKAICWWAGPLDILLTDVYPENQPMQVSRWGNSLAIRLPASVVEALGLKEGDSIEIHAAGKRTFEIERMPGARELLARLRKFRGRLPKDFKFDRLEANERR